MRQSLIFLFYFLISTAFAQVQVSDRQIDAWLKALSTKNDPGEKTLDVVAGEVLKMDSSTWCETVDQVSLAAQHESVRCQIRARLLQNIMNGSGMHCPDHPDRLDNLKKALQAAYEIEDEALQYDIHLDLGQIYNGAGQYGLATMHFHMLFDILRRNDREDFYLPSGAFYDMSFGLYHTHDYDACIKTGLNALFELPNAPILPDDSLNVYQRMLQWNTIGLAYHKTQRPDSAFLAFNNAEEIAKAMNNSFWVGIINGNIGDVYYDLGQFDSAYVLLQYDYDHSIAEHQFDNAANSLQWIARIDLRNGKTKDALQKLHTARRHLLEMPQANYLANVDFAFSQVYAELGQADSVNEYLQQYLYLHDSLQSEITKSQTDILQIRMNNLDQIQTIKILNRQKRHISLTRNFTIAVVVLLGCLGYMWLVRSRLKMQMRQREALEGKRIAEAETQKAIGQLDIFRNHLLEKNALIEKWQTAYETKENSEDQTKILSDLTHHLILREEDWLQFKELFDSVYPGFFLLLRNKVPDISQAEQRMAALSKLKLTAKEAANLLGVSPNTVYTTRRRLRQRLGLEQDSDLDPYFTSFVS
ncbi:MAG TPA: hypothetical protein VMZ69_10920 [Saprospiraceae bacterium]|nr:hypothetical protein [Saprospiraceae bacterium]